MYYILTQPKRYRLKPVGVLRMKMAYCILMREIVAWLHYDPSISGIYRLYFLYYCNKIGTQGVYCCFTL